MHDDSLRRRRGAAASRQARVASAYAGKLHLRREPDDGRVGLGFADRRRSIASALVNRLTVVSRNRVDFQKAGVAVLDPFQE